MTMAVTLVYQWFPTTGFQTADYWANKIFAKKIVSVAVLLLLA